MKGEYYKGYVKKTQRQEKKHYTQFTKEEKEILTNKTNQINTSFIDINYIHINKKNVVFDKNTIFNTLNNNNYTIIEYNEVYYEDGTIKDKRVLIRSHYIEKVSLVNKKNEEYLCDCNLCFVISLLSYKVLTVYWNPISDNHNSLDWNRYNKNIIIAN